MNLSDILQDQNPWWRDSSTRSARTYPFRRDIQPLMLSRLLGQDQSRAMILLGPRQVGKTILLLQLADDLLSAGWPPQSLTYFDFSDARLTAKVPVRDIVEMQPFGFTPKYPRALLFNEICCAHGWDQWLNQSVEPSVGKIVATASAADLPKGEGPVVGWSDEHVIEPLSFREFARLQGPRRVDRALAESYLANGGFPKHAGGADHTEVRRRLRSDIAERAIARDLAGLGVDVQRVKDLFVYLVQDSGAELNAESRGRDLGADPRSVREWVRLLTDTLLIAPLERQIRHPATGLRSRSKVYAGDPGLVTAFALSPTEDPGVRARVFEAAVFRHLREAAREMEGRLSYFRHKDDLEIDFVLEFAGRTVGIEVTSSLRVRPDKLGRLRKPGKPWERTACS